MAHELHEWEHVSKSLAEQSPAPPEILGTPRIPESSGRGVNSDPPADAFLDANEDKSVSPERKLFLLPGWTERLAEEREQRHRRPEKQMIVPLAPRFFSHRLTYVDSSAGAKGLLDFARQRPLSFIGIDCEYRYARPGVPIKKDRLWFDPRSIEPLLLALTLVEPQSDKLVALYSFVIDLRRPEVLDPLRHLLELPLVFCTHYSQAELFCLWQLGLPTPALLWDTWAAERAFLLGLYHGRYQSERPQDAIEEPQADEEADDQIAFNCKLVTSCQRRGVPYRFAGDKDRLQASFLTASADERFTEEQLAYAAADAEAVARLYPAQVQIAIDKGCLDHLKTVEMPWAVTNAAMIWKGVRVDPTACQQLRDACERHQKTLSQKLAALGIHNASSHPQVYKFFQTIGLLDAFRVRNKYTIDDDHLEVIEDRHPAIPWIRDARKIKRLLSEKMFSGELIGADGRLHPQHHQLGAESGRNTMSWPNIGGIGRALRPAVVPEPGYGIGEVDLSQIEVAIAAALVGDRDLIQMVNGRDVYTAMAQRYCADANILPPDAQRLSDQEFKKKYRPLRDRMKIFTLAIIYNITPFGLSLQLNISVERATQERQRFLAMFPQLANALQEASIYGAIRGYAYLCSGLRRWRARTGRPSPWEINWLRNTPVQGSAGVVFKVAGNRLFRRYQHYGAHLVLPMHDAFVFETPWHHLSTVAKITAEVMRSSVQEYFPMLDPQVDINIDHPHCWNKDGQYRSLRLWMASPEAARRYL
jgi:DNA polymerase-1